MTGPPYISSYIFEDSLPGPLGTHPGLKTCYHIRLDETRLWNVSCVNSLDTSQGNSNEFNIAFYKPTLTGNDFIGQFNKDHPDESGSWTDAKFDNEDIYVQGTFKHSPDPNQAFNFCALLNAQVAETGEEATLTFGGDQESTASITITLVP